ncbi:MAG: hypothetical protein C4290_11000, partial [Chloroflexota bacterium]
MALHAYLAASSIWVPDLASAEGRLGDLGFLVLVVGLTPIVFATDPEVDTDDLLMMCYWVAVVYAVGGMAGPLTDEGRMAAFGGGPNVFVRVMGTGLIAGIYRWGRDRRARWLCGVPFFCYGAVLSGSRGGLVALAVAVAPFAVHTARRAGVKLRALLAVAAPTVMLFVVNRHKVAQFVAQRFVAQTLGERYASGRDVIFADAWRTFQEHPWFGVGLDGFRQTTLTGEEHAHNLLLQVAAEGG